MLVDKTKSTQEEGWIAVGSGNGSVAVETYAEAVALATNDNIGQVIYVKTKSSYDADGEGEGEAIEYEAAPYIVIGEGQLQKLAASTASGNLDADVAQLKTKVADIDSTVKTATADIEALKAIDHDAYIAADAILKGELEGAIAGKVAQESYDAKVEELEGAIASKVAQESYDAKVEELEGEIAKKVEAVEGSRLMSDAEGTKLAGIADGAQVNVIEKVKVNGAELTVANADKSVDITIPSAPVQGVVSKDGQILTLSEDGKLDTTLKIAYVKATETEKAQLRLQGVNDAVISSIDATDFIKDGMIESVVLDGPKEGETGKKYLAITWNLDSGKEVIRLDVSELFNPYTASNGVALADGNFSLKLATGEQYLTVTTDGLATTQALWDKVNELDNAVLETAENYATSAETAAKAYADANFDVKGAAASAETAAKAYADANFDVKGAAASAETAAKAYADANFDVKGAAASAETAAKAYADANFDVKGAATSAETAAKAYADANFVTKDGFNEFEAEYEEKLNGIANGAEVNVIDAVKVNGIDATITDKVAEVKVDAKDIELGEAIMNGEEEKYAANAKISTVLQSIQESIRGAIAGGVNSISSGDKAITVNSADANNPVVTLNTEVSSEETVANGHIEIVKGDNGIYAAMYYDGDDVE